MAFHRNLIDLFWEHAAGAGPQLRPGTQRSAPAKARLLMEWQVDDDGRLHARWTQARD